MEQANTPPSIEQLHAELREIKVIYEALTKKVTTIHDLLADNDEYKIKGLVQRVTVLEVWKEKTANRISWVMGAWAVFWASIAYAYERMKKD